MCGKRQIGATGAVGADERGGRRPPLRQPPSGESTLARGQCCCTGAAPSTVTPSQSRAASFVAALPPAPAGRPPSSADIVTDLGPGGRVVEEAGREAHFPTQQPTPGQAPRLPAPDGHPRRPQRAAEPAAQGSPPPLGLIWRIRDRQTFVQLRRSGRRARRGPVTVTFLPAGDGDHDHPPRVAFAVPRKVGPAVARNRIRRCVRARLLERARDPRRSLAPGAYLVSVGPAAAGLDGSVVADAVEACLDGLDART
jgi:ribonuclease P protein component